jgi:hypothetical protein
MNDKNQDIFETSQVSISKQVNENFFLNENTITNPFENAFKESFKSINDYDLNLLQEDAYKDVNDEIFKLEYKIHKIEEELNIINSQIQVAIDINDYNLIKKLSLRKSFLENNHKNLLDSYNDKSISTRISDVISKILNPKSKNKYNPQNNYFINLINKLSTKLPKKFLSLYELKNSLNKLENLNKSVYDLISIKTAYNNSEKYEQLSKYIIKANSIQAQIKNSIKKK